MKNYHSTIIKKGLKFLSRQPQSLIFPLLADLYRQQGHLQKAEKICQQGLQKHPQCCRGYNALGRIYFDQGAYPKAQNAFEKALDLEPNNLLTLRFLGQIYIQLRNIPQALKVYKMLVLFYPNQTFIQNILEKLEKASTERYLHFSSLSLNETAHELDQKEFLQRPSIQPLPQTSHSHTTPLETALTQIQEIPSSLNRFPITRKSKRNQKISYLKKLMDRLSSPSEIKTSLHTGK